MKLRYLAVSSTPAMPMTRLRGKPVTSLATHAMTSSGFETTMTIASGEHFLISSLTDLTIATFVRIKSSRLIPGLRATPAVTMNISLPVAGP